MKTAVEWLEEQIYLYGINPHQSLFEQAKEMEKEQHDNTAEEWWKQGAHYMESGRGKWESFEQYYKQTFKSE